MKVPQCIIVSCAKISRPALAVSCVPWSEILKSEQMDNDIECRSPNQPPPTAQETLIAGHARPKETRGTDQLVSHSRSHIIIQKWPTLDKTNCERSGSHTQSSVPPCQVQDTPVSQSLSTSLGETSHFEATAKTTPGFLKFENN
jgi:hypothetical protein